MKQSILSNGINLVYENCNNDITSFSIAFDAGAIVENKDELGLAHVVEHMIFKGTKTRNESKINKLCDEYFGFNNAMTNYPYVVYYGTCLSSNFEKAFELYSDIIKNPVFPSKGFKEEIDVIKQELKEWKDDLTQYCEDELLFNSFDNRRIKNIIIGNEKSISSFTRYDVIRFYERHYFPGNCVISVVSSLDFDKVYHIVDKYFSNWHSSLENHLSDLNNKESNYLTNKFSLYERNKKGIFVKLKKDIKTSKIQYLYSIDSLSENEVKALRLFNEYLGEGTSSVLYDVVRTKNGLAYDITSNIKNEIGIKLFTILVGTSKDKINETLSLINNEIENCKMLKGVFTKEYINKLSNRIRLKRFLKLEQSIRLSMNLAVYGIMYDSPSKLYDDVNELKRFEEKDILNVVNKVFNNPSIQIVEPI